MKRTTQKLEFLKGSTHLSVLIAGLLATGAVAADTVKDMLPELEKTLEPAKPVKATKEMVEQLMITREILGLKSDRRFVEQILTNPSKFEAVSGALTGGHHATPDEVESLKIRLILQDDAIALVPQLSEDPDFAGIFIDRKNQIQIGFTFAAEQRVEELRQKVAMPERLVAFSAKRSMQQLENSKDRIVDSSQQLNEQGIVVSKVAVDVENNRITIGVTKLDPHVRDTLQQLFGDVNVIESELNQVEARADTASPMRAGVRITNSSGGSCTSNWKARDRTTGEFVTVTAGHCAVDINGTLGGPGQDFFQGTTSTGATRALGTSDQTTWTFPGFNPVTGGRVGSDDVDALRVPWASGIFSMPWLYAYDDANSGIFANGEQVRVGAVDGTVVVGTLACSGGQYSPGNQIGGSNWKNCGSVNAVNVANGFNRRPGSPDRFTITNTNEATYTAIGGDSGAPTWRIGYNSSQRWHAIAMGHHTGGPPGSEVFNDIDRVENALNVDVITF